VLTARRGGVHRHLSLFGARRFGIVVYDEVHLLPAPVFRMTASLQAVRRLGLTATLLREDGKEDDVFALIGPKRYDVPWKTLERRSFIAEAECVEARVHLDPATRCTYAGAEPAERFRIAASCAAKDDVVSHLLERHGDRQALVMGVYVEQLKRLAERLGLSLITGETPAARRAELYAAYRRGEIRTLVISRVGSFALDLPGASVGIEVSGTYGSRQEEAQRLGRLLRPKEETALFYTVVARDTVEQDFALRRQRFLAEQGYRYRVEEMT
jgi:DNA excision repair protein ERCC-3